MVNEASGPLAGPLPGVTALIEVTQFTLDEPIVLVVVGADETACSSPANMPNGCGGWCGTVVCGGGVGDADATDAGVDEARGVRSSGAPEVGGLLLFSLPLYR